MHSSCSLLAAAVLFALFISSPRCVSSQDNPATIINSIGMKFVLIPEGTFQMGAPFEEEFARDDEEPHEVTLSTGYYLGVTEVTQGQYEKVMGTNPAHFQTRVIRKSDSSMYPVERVSWERAVEFCRKLSELPEEKASGRVYQLPTEAQWEYACRAGSKSAYSFGESSKS
ncbi:MAG: formylglycine-generating enzyme family protein, partial [Planctomyces sp.]